MSINILLLIVILAAAFKMTDGYKKGMVKEIISLVSLVVLCAVVSLLASGISSYHEGRFFNVIIVVILLAILGIVHHLLGVVFFSAKVISKLPVLHFVNKLLGVVFGVLEVVFVLWTVYTFIMMMDMGAIGQVILSFTEESEILSWIYRHNWLAYGIERAMEEFSFAPLPTL
ncbi:MAG: CvpA family protein [Acetatifactor sp.]